MGVRTWSWYMPIATSNFFKFFVAKKVSAENGPLTKILFFISFFIAGIIILFSSLILFMLSQCGFKPSTAINGFLFKWFV